VSLRPCVADVTAVYRPTQPDEWRLAMSETPAMGRLLYCIVTNNKKFCYRRLTARRHVSFEMLPTAAKQCRNNLYDKFRTNGSNGVREDYSRATYNKLVHSATTRSTVVGIIHKLTVDEFVDCTNTPIRYDTRCYFNVRSKADIGRLNLPHGNDN